MMAKFLSRSKIVAVIDIGSGFVGCAFLSLQHAGPSTVVGYGHSRLTLEKRTYVQARAHLSAEIAEAIASARSAAGQALRGVHIGDVHVVLHAPWSSSQIATVTESYDKDTHIQASHIAALAKRSLAEHEVDTAQLFEKRVIAIKLNGYPTAAPEGKHARALELSAILSLGDPALVKSITAELHTAFPAAKIFLASAENAYATILRRSVGSSEDALIVDVGVSETHLIVLRGGVPQNDRSVPGGMQGMLARIQGSDASAETLSFFRMHARDVCESEACMALQKTIASAELELVKVFGEHFAKLAEQRHLPNTLLLVAHPDISEWLASFFERIDFTQFTRTTMPFASRAVDAALLPAWIAADTHLDAPLALASAYAAKQEQST